MCKAVPRITIVCRSCGKAFQERASRGRAYCSRECSNTATALRYAEGRIACKCEACGADYLVYPARSAVTRFCSMMCKQGAIARETIAARSEALRNKCVAPKRTTYRKLRGRHIHRIVAEEKLGRPLVAGEVVHHIDGNRHNNHPDNLDIITPAEHARLHGTKGRKCTVAGCNRKHVAKGFCMNHWKRNRKQLSAIEAGEMIV